MLGSVHDADDALQDTMLRAWRGAAGLRDPSAARGWLYSIATNVCRDAREYQPTAGSQSAGIAAGTSG
jgi:RNA polymerase sigma-70 factor, ECF subfamily